MNNDDMSAQPSKLPADIFGLVGTVLDRKFRIDRIVAEGGFGVVYYGMHLTLEKPVAVKVLKTPSDFNERAKAAFIEKFALEGKTMARISHPSIVQVLDFGASPMPSGEMAPWMVLEWLTGDTLEHLLQGRRGSGGYSPEETLRIARPILEALAYAHDEGIAHRDIKPANMMMVKGKRGSALRLMDFGIAKMMEAGEGAGSGATRTRTTMNAFSPQYAAPEQISGTRTGPWTDVHALALIMTEMLTDRPPYEGGDMTALFGQILSPVRPTPARFGVDVGPWEPILTRAMVMKPDDRFKNAGEFLAALEGAMPQMRQMVAGGQFGATIVGPAQTSGNPTPVSPTTLRGSAVVTSIPSSNSNGPSSGAILGGAVALAACAAGMILFLGHGRTAQHSVPAAVVQTATPPVAPPPVAQPPTVPAPVVPPPVVAPSTTTTSASPSTTSAQQSTSTPTSGQHPSAAHSSASQSGSESGRTSSTQGHDEEHRTTGTTNRPARRSGSSASHSDPVIPLE